MKIELENILQVETQKKVYCVIVCLESSKVLLRMLDSSKSKM